MSESVSLRPLSIPKLSCYQRQPWRFDSPYRTKTGLVMDAVVTLHNRTQKKFLADALLVATPTRLYVVSTAWKAFQTSFFVSYADDMHHQIAQKTRILVISLLLLCKDFCISYFAEISFFYCVNSWELGAKNSLPTHLTLRAERQHDSVQHARCK